VNKTKSTYYILSISFLLLGIFVVPILLVFIFGQGVLSGPGLGPILPILVILFFLSASVVFLILGLFERNNTNARSNYKPVNPLVTLAIGIILLLVAIFEIYITDPATLVLYIGGPLLIISGSVNLVKKYFKK